MQSEFKVHHALGRGFRVHVPKGKGPFPTILFLHGMGESGGDNERQITVGLPALVTQGSIWEQFLIVAPQKLDEYVLWPGYANWLDEVLKIVDEEYDRDRSRTYLTGLSQGGNGTWTLARSLRWQFAAIAPVCGWADPSWAAQTLRTTPIWAFHGTSDDIVDPAGTQMTAHWLARYGGIVKTTFFDEVGHNSWDLAYSGEELAEWFLLHQLRL